MKRWLRKAAVGLGLLVAAAGSTFGHTQTTENHALYQQQEELATVIEQKAERFQEELVVAYEFAETQANTPHRAATTIRKGEGRISAFSRAYQELHGTKPSQEEINLYFSNNGFIAPSQLPATFLEPLYVNGEQVNPHYALEGEEISVTTPKTAEEQTAIRTEWRSSVQQASQELKEDRNTLDRLAQEQEENNWGGIIASLFAGAGLAAAAGAGAYNATKRQEQQARTPPLLRGKKTYTQPPHVEEPKPQPINKGPYSLRELQDDHTLQVVYRLHYTDGETFTSTHRREYDLLSIICRNYIEQDQLLLEPHDLGQVYGASEREVLEVVAKAEFLLDRTLIPNKPTYAGTDYAEDLGSRVDASDGFFEDQEIQWEKPQTNPFTKKDSSPGRIWKTAHSTEELLKDIARHDPFIHAS